MSGWVKIHRKMLDSAFFNKPNYVSLWMCLLLSASHSRSTFIWNGEELTIESGQLLTGRKELSRKTGIAETTVERILNHFEKYGQIGQLKTSKYRLITIRKWGEYQIVDNKRTTNGQQTDTFKNVKKEKNISEPKVSGDIPLTDNQTTVGWNNKSDNDSDLPEIDMDSREEVKPKTKKIEKKVSNDIQAVFNLFNNPARPLWVKRDIERIAAQALFDTYGIEKLTIRMKRIESEKQKKDPYFPEVNTPSQLLDKMPNVERYLNL